MSPESAPAVTPAEQRLVAWFFRPGPDGRGGQLNLAYNALDRHVIRGLSDEAALVLTDPPPRGRVQVRFAELLTEVAQLGGGLLQLGVDPGAHVLVVLPEGPDLVVALLACARVGAVIVTLDPDALTPEAVAAAELVAPAPQVVITDAVRKDAVDVALEAAGFDPGQVLVHQRGPVPAVLDRPRDVDIALLTKPGSFEPAVCAELPVAAPLAVRAGGPDGAELVDQTAVVRLCAAVTAAGLAPGSRTSGATLDDDFGLPYAALLAPLLVGATVLLPAPTG